VSTKEEEATESKAFSIVWLSKLIRERDVNLLCWATLSHSSKSGHDSIASFLVAVVLGNSSKLGHIRIEYSLKAGNWETGRFLKSLKSGKLLS